MSDSLTTPPGTLEDVQQLRLLAVLHYVLGGVTVASLPAWIWLAWYGYPLLYGANRGAGQIAPGEEYSMLLGAAFIIVGVAFGALCVLHAALLAYLGRCIARRRRRRFVLAVSVFNTTYVPLGTVISLLAIIVLLRPSVKALFDQQTP